MFVSLSTKSIRRNKWLAKIGVKRQLNAGDSKNFLLLIKNRFENKKSGIMVVEQVTFYSIIMPANQKGGRLLVYADRTDTWRWVRIQIVEKILT